MPIALDHVFVLTTPQAAVGDRLIEFGLVEGSPNTHPGQGTANRRFFFANFMLEFLYVSDADEALNGPGAGMRLADRVAAAGASPFGFVLRGDPSEFPGWTYFPDYFPDGVGFHVSANSDDLTEPLCILIPDEMIGKGSFSQSDVQDSSLTSARVSWPGPTPSRPLSALGRCRSVEVRSNSPHRLELLFDGGKTGRSLELSPVAPVTLRM